MSIYVCSDLHGEYEKFMSLLKLINFSDNDKLYILGDIFYNGNGALEIMDYIMDKENIIPIIGNCDQEFYNEATMSKNNEFIEDEDDEDDFIEPTCAKLFARGEEYTKKVLDYISNMPYYLLLDKYILVHGGLKLPKNYKELSISEILEVQDKEFCTWTNELAKNDEYIDGYTMILGHTQTRYLEGIAYKILKKKNKILIDCSASLGGNLAALRLDDMEEFYI